MGLETTHFLLLTFKFGISGPQIQMKNFIKLGYNSCSESLERQCLKNLQQKHQNHIPFTNVLMQIFKSFKSLGHLHSPENPEHLLHIVRQA